MSKFTTLHHNNEIEISLSKSSRFDLQLSTKRKVRIIQYNDRENGMQVSEEKINFSDQ